MSFKPELLSPAGDLATCKLAIDHGADAVYVGFEQFSARAKAKNLQMDEMEEAISYAHARGAKIFCALNIVLFNDELESAIEAMAKLVAYGIDAFIVQDFGIATLLLSHFPETEVHASTQMAIMNVCGAQTMEALGFDRVVLARETSLEMMQQIRNQSDIDLEVFVQGALCVSYSGLCYMSSLQGDRSGNRGQCAQPCRRRYTLLEIDGKGGRKELAENYLLSPKDMNLLEDVSMLMDVPVQSLKIEGRMKQPEYVALMTDVYRRQLDKLAMDRSVSQEEIEKDLRDMATVFNREGFSKAYLHGVPGASMMSYRTPKNTGIPLGQIKKMTRSRCTIRLKESLHTGDGVAFYDADLQPLWGGYVEQLSTEKGEKGKAFDAGTTVDFKHGLEDDAALQKVVYCYKTFDKELSKSLLKVRSLPKPAIEQRGVLHFFVEAQYDKPITMVALFNGRGEYEEMTATYNWQGDFIVEPSKNGRSSRDVVVNALSKLGQSHYEIGTVEVNGPEDAFVPMSVATAGRHAAVKYFDALFAKEENEEDPDELSSVDVDARIESCLEVLDAIPPQIRISHEPVITVQVRTWAQAMAALEAGAEELNVLLLDTYRDDGLSDEQIINLSKQIPMIVSLSPLIKEVTEEVYYQQRCRYLAENGLQDFMVSNIGQVQLLEAIGVEYTACDYQLNVTNDLTASALSQIGVLRQTLSLEIDKTRIESFSSIGSIPLELVVYGRLPAMNTRYCPMGSIVGHREIDRPCSRPCTKRNFALEREGKRYDLRSDRYCNVYLLNDKTYDLMPHIGEIADLCLDFWRIAGAWLSPDEITEVVRQLVMLRKQAFEKTGRSVLTTFSNRTTQGHFIKGVR